MEICISSEHNLGLLRHWGSIDLKWRLENCMLHSVFLDGVGKPLNIIIFQFIYCSDLLVEDIFEQWFRDSV